MLARHVYYFTMATTMWTVFFLIGLPSNYYQGWPFAAQFGFVLTLPTLVLGVLGAMRFRPLPRARALGLAAVMALHFTVPLFVYDWIYLGQHRGLGWSFLASHWYLSWFYLIPWIELPLIAWVVADRAARGDDLTPSSPPPPCTPGSVR
ncbi:MAG: hypothetical protein SFV19_08045 [Rhodospirillaceae bacterium]|nr:hypothetical protein [Rhodospirillaceae bacterium]